MSSKSWKYSKVNSQNIEDVKETRPRMLATAVAASTLLSILQFSLPAVAANGSFGGAASATASLPNSKKSLIALDSDEKNSDDDDARVKTGSSQDTAKNGSAMSGSSDEAKTDSKAEDDESKSKTGSQRKDNGSDEKPKPHGGKIPTALPPSFYIDSKYSRKIITKVDAAITKKLYSKNLAQTVWKDALKKHYETISSSKNLRELGNSFGAVFAALNSSHCNFVTANDEMYHFLHALFSDFNKKLSKGKIDYVGFVTGGAPFADNQVRYVLDESPAAKAGLRIGDRVLKFNGINYVGYVNFLDTAGTNSTISIERNGETKSIAIKPEKVDLYHAYAEAMRKSAKIEEVNGKKIGYVHVWCGGRRSYEALDEIMEEKLDATDGLIFDLRDGYGGNSLSDLDRFYRNPKAYPDFVTVDRSGKKNTSRMYYDKPMVAIINGGSRSGKELVSFSLKGTGRAKLVGMKTAGAVLAGSITPIDEKTTAYIAVLDGTIGGVRLEGVGVAPDVEIDNKTHDQIGYEKQLSVARETLLELIKNQSSAH